MMTGPILEIEGLSKKYSTELGVSKKYAVLDFLNSGDPGKISFLRDKEFWALKNISLKVQRGEVLGVLGHNGAGKSTLLKCIVSKLRPDLGSVRINGAIGHLLDMSAGFSNSASGRDNIILRGRLMGKFGGDLDEFVSSVRDFADIGDFFDAPVQFYSSGMRARLGFSASCMTKPDLLIIDEVLSVGDLAFRLKCYEKIDEISRNAAVIFVSHSIGQLARMCNRGVYLEKGNLLYDGGIQDAIKLYQDFLQSKGVGKSSVTYHPELVEIKLLVNNKQHSFQDDISYASDLVLDADISNLEKNAQLRVVLKDSSSTVLADWNSARSIKSWPNNSQRVRISLGKAELTPGLYSIYLQAMTANGREHISISESIKFRVTGDFYYAVPLQKMALWSFC
jgi:lipopolysaccharide transport system ATP-binding protein